ncbi:hypothetical protein AQULUS_05210 [Aquicella lusitana]|uniref:Uncharacterized protein n=1 Tax=Aquicella lusitana TaxID=254246 RepID=A0A370GT80_9COXI|nr:hypothetical protein C8D86_1079 [Aquicella lusitana]VVC72797.1 hypothetical protein AQULUS_05210 [Aquicella lusitana]
MIFDTVGCNGVDKKNLSARLQHWIVQAKSLFVTRATLVFGFGARCFGIS